MDTIYNEKKRIRRDVLKRRLELSDEERLEASLLITEKIIAHRLFIDSDIVLAFVGYGTEIDTAGIIEEALKRGKRVYVPKVVGQDMLFYRIESMDDLEEGYKGIFEPSGESEMYDYFLFDKAYKGENNKTFMLMPGVAFDRENNRIGYGKGFYDRFLQDKEALKPRTVAIGYKCQMLERIPCEVHDFKPGEIIVV